jgi:Predicted transcriptional regulator
MKIDRLLEMVIYLLNHENVSAKYLAEYFQVSVRTIQRDMVSMAVAGIPVYSNAGKKGGYSILPEYKVKNQMIKEEENQLVIKALRSLATTYPNQKLNSLIEKYSTMIDEGKYRSIFWDFSIAKENGQVQELLYQLENMIMEKKLIRYLYRNAKGHETEKTVQPLAVYYKWYAWYLFAYVPEKKEYRNYKVARIRNLKATNARSNQQHDDIEKLMLKSEEEYKNTVSEIEIQFNKEDKILLEEYFPDTKIEKSISGKLKMKLYVPQKERLWQALLLSFGDKVQIIAPVEYRDELIDTAKKFLSNYDIGMSR